MNTFMVFDIGCIECGEESQPVGFYGTREAAEAAVEEYLDGGTSWGKTGWHGQHSVQIFAANIKLHYEDGTVLDPTFVRSH